MKKLFFYSTVFVLILACGHCYAGPEQGGIVIETDKSVYRVGDTIKVKVIVRDIPPPGSKGYMGAVVMFPEITAEEGQPVEKIGTGDMSKRMSSLQNKPKISGNERIFEISWKIEDREWKNVLTGEIVYQGPGLEAGSTMAGSFVYCLGKLPAEYEVSMVRFKKAVLDHYAYKADPLDPNQVISNKVRIKILPAEKGGRAR
jgi:hypothetical protein